MYLLPMLTRAIKIKVQSLEQKSSSNIRLKMKNDKNGRNKEIKIDSLKLHFSTNKIMTERNTDLKEYKDLLTKKGENKSLCFDRNKIFSNQILNEKLKKAISKKEIIPYVRSTVLSSEKAKRLENQNSNNFSYRSTSIRSSKNNLKFDSEQIP